MSMWEPAVRPSRRSGQPALNVPPATLWIALILVGVHASLLLAGPVWTETVWIRFAFVPADLAVALGPEGELGGPIVTTLVSHMLLHANWSHLAINVGFLLGFGSVAERSLGLTRYVLFLIACGVVGALSLFAVSPFAEVLVIGASGAVYGAAGAATRLVFARRRGVRGAVIFVVAMMSFNVIFAFVNLGLLSDGSAVAWEAHAGAFLAGLVLIYLLPLRRYR